MTACQEEPAVAPLTVAGGAADRVPACGSRLRLRAMAAMGHSAARLAVALGRSRTVVQRLIDGTTTTVSPELHRDITALCDRWWDKVPPERTPAERRAAEQARRRAKLNGWCTPLALDEDLTDVPGYVPQAGWRRATGIGAADDDPLGLAS
jgi:hypothetical protein